MTHPKPVLVLSKCLELEACRYNGQIVRAPFVKVLLPFVEARPVCPEVEIGLGVPRDPIRLVKRGAGAVRLEQPSTGRNLTPAMKTFSQEFLNGLGDVDGFILKGRSPSCGIRDTKVHGAGPRPQPVGKGAGMFGAAVLKAFPRAAIEDEGRLTNARLRHHFLAKLFANARFRAARSVGTTAALVAFHTEYKFLLLACNQAATRQLGRIVAAPVKGNRDAMFTAYAHALAQALERPPRIGATINALMHAFGFVSDDLSAREKAHFLDVLVELRQERQGLPVALTMLQSWVARFDQHYLERQAFLEPYPRELLNLGDSARGSSRRRIG